MTNVERIQNAIIPALLYNIFRGLDQDNGTVAECKKVSSELVEAYLSGTTRFRRNKLNIMLKSVTVSIYNHFTKNKFDTTKAILVLHKWLIALIEAEALDLEFEEYRDLVGKLEAYIELCFEKKPDFDKVDASAAKQTAKVHKIAQKYGYF